MSCRIPNIAFAWKIARARGLKPNERLIYFAIAERARGEALECWPTLPQLAADTGLSARAAHTAVHKLNARKDLITIERRCDGLHYFFKRTDAETAQESHESSPKPSATLFPDADVPEDVAASELQDLQDASLPEPMVVASSELQIPQDAQPPAEGGNLQDLQDASCTRCKTSNEVPQVPPKLDASLRSAPPAPLRVGGPDVVDVRRELFSEGLDTLRGLTGKSSPSCRKMLGMWLRDSRDDGAAVLDAIRRAADLRPAEPVAFITGCMRPKPQLGVIDQLRAGWGLKTFLAPIIDPDPETDQQARIGA